MRILWVSARLIGPAAKIVNSDYKGTSGGWIQTEYEALEHEKHEMFYICGTRDKTCLHKKTDSGEVFCVQLPMISNGIPASKNMIKQIQGIINRVNPDIIQLWGTETCIQDAVAACSKEIPKVVFIQGLIGIHNRYKGGYIDISNPDYKSYIPAHRKFLQKVRNVAFRGQIEIEKRIFRQCRNIILDNDFTRAYCMSVDSNLNFYERHLNANQVFRDKVWSVQNADKNSIFTVYGASPDKGLHQLIKAVSLLKNDYPTIKVYIPGPFSVDENGILKVSPKTSSLERWLSSYINQNGLQRNIAFVGSQDGAGMANLIRKCNVYVNPSCMEVHALSLREAMTVGAPCISSLCGSVAEYLENGKNGYLYRYEEYEMLAFLIRKILLSEELAEKLGRTAREDMSRYFMQSNDQPLDLIYSNIIAENNV